jgi:predicted transposase YdaD
MRRDTIFFQLFQQFPTLLFELLPEPPERADEYIFELSTGQKLEVVGRTRFDGSY